MEEVEVICDCSIVDEAFELGEGRGDGDVDSGEGGGGEVGGRAVSDGRCDEVEEYCTCMSWYGSVQH